MNDVVIKVENLSKLYKLGLIHHDRLAEAITAGLKRTSTALRSLFSRESSSNAMPALWNAKPIPPGPSSSQSSSSNPMPSVYPVAPADDTGVSLEDRTGAQCAMPSSSDDTIWALRNVSFEVKRGEVLGIIGRNGAGKTTLLKILTGITEPTEGRVWMKGRIASLLEVGTGFHPELTGRENIFLNGAILGMTRVEIRQKFDEIVEFAEIEKFIDTPVKRFSSGMYVRLAFAVAAHLEPEILLVDEVLAVGDIAFQKKCLGKMGDVSKEGRTVLFISHNMLAIRQLCPTVLLIDSGCVVTAGDCEKVTQTYLNGILKNDKNQANLPPGYIYYCPQAQYRNKYAITGIELLDKAGDPIKTLRTWDFVRFRIHFKSKMPIRRGAVELKIHTGDSRPLIRSSTQPDFNLPYVIKTGLGYVDCVFPKWPLAQGDYFVEAGLTVPGMYYLCWESNTELKVMERDVFGSGYPPISSRSLAVPDHHWELPQSSPECNALEDYM